MLLYRELSKQSMIYMKVAQLSRIPPRSSRALAMSMNIFESYIGQSVDGIKKMISTKLYPTLPKNLDSFESNRCFRQNYRSYRAISRIGVLSPRTIRTLGYLYSCVELFARVVQKYTASLFTYCMQTGQQPDI